MKNAIPIAAVLIASFAGGAALQAGDLGQAPWFISRASGIVAFALLSASVILGLILSTKSARPLIPRALSFELHRFLSVLTLTFVGVHAGSLLFDGFLRFTPLSILVPFASPYRPIWTGVGVISAWAAALVTASFAVRARIGYRAWRRFHYVSFGAYLLSLAHGMTAGTDSTLPAVYGLYVLSAATIAALLTYRVGQGLESAPSRSAAKPGKATGGLTVRS